MGKALCDSGASINLMPLFVATRLSLGELTPTAMTLQMADWTLAHLEGILQDVLIKVGKNVFLVDFVVINIEEDKQVSLLLGRPFLATGATLIDVKKVLGYGKNIQSDWNINAAEFKKIYPLTHQGSHAFHKNRRKGK